MTDKIGRNRVVISDKQFVKAWMKYDYSWEVAEALGLRSSGTVNEIAHRLRKRGVRIPYRYGRLYQTSVDELNELIEIMEKETHKGKD